MNVYDFAAAMARRPPRAVTPDDQTASFGKVYEIEIARRARNARIPDSVLHETEAADALFHTLQDEGRQIRFDQVGGRVVATMCDLDGTVLRPMSLREAIAIPDPDTAA